MSDFKSAVNDFYNDYHRKVKSNPDLYVKNANHLTVCLPESLKDYCNAAAGRSSDQAGATPNGIRIATDNPLALRDAVMSTTDTVEAFIRNSACDASNIGRRVVKTVKTDDRLMSAKGSRNLMSRRYGPDILIELGRKFGRTIVKLDLDALTINEFELRYGLSA